MPTVLDSLRIKARPVLNDRREQLRVRYHAIAHYSDRLVDLLKTPAIRLTPVITAYAAQLDQFFRLIETPGEHPALKREALHLSVHVPFVHLNAAVQRQPTAELREDVRKMAERELDIPVVMERLVQICENRQEKPAVRIQALTSFQAVSRATQASLQPDFPANTYTDRMTVLALQNDTSGVSRQVITLGLI